MSNSQLDILTWPESSFIHTCSLSFLSSTLVILSQQTPLSKITPCKFEFGDLSETLSAVTTTTTTPPDSFQIYLKLSTQRGEPGWNRSLKELVPNRLTFIAASRKPQPTLAGFAWGQIFPAEGASLQGCHTAELEVEKFGLKSLPPVMKIPP